MRVEALDPVLSLIIRPSVRPSGQPKPTNANNATNEQRTGHKCTTTTSQHVGQTKEIAYTHTYKCTTRHTLAQAI